jgi:hypothetical protein
VAAVVEEEEVPGARVVDEPGELSADVGARGLRLRGVGVDEDADVVLVEAEAVDEAAAHAVDVVVAALELGLGARVVDAHQERALAAHRGGVDLAWIGRRRWGRAEEDSSAVVVEERGQAFLVARRVDVDWPFPFSILPTSGGSELLRATV